MKPSILKKLPKSNSFTDFVRVGALAFIISTLLIAAAHALSIIKDSILG